MVFLPADYALIAVTAVMAVLGLFRGLSGMIAFIAASVVSVFVATFGWNYTSLVSETLWVRAIADIVVTLLIFGVVRLIIQKVINGILAQPSDAIFGMLLGLSSGLLLALAWARSGIYLEYSNLVKEIAGVI